MTSFAIYLLNCILCMGVFYVFYLLMYHNRPQHQWNRLYLLSSGVLGVVLPLITVELPVSTPFSSTEVVQLLNVVPSKDLPLEDTPASVTSVFNLWMIAAGLYACISFAFLILFTRSIIRVVRLYRTSEKEKLDGVTVVATNEKDAPFTFMRTIYWNAQIDRHTEPGARIFAHELTHASQLHSVDRLFVNFLLIFFWFNPFLWLIRRELTMVHEFIADRKSVTNRDVQVFSQMILLSAYGRNRFDITSKFFHSPIKRRLSMLTKSNNSRFASAGKWLLLPVVLILFASFSIRKQQSLVPGVGSPFVLVIDAGHGGSSSGVVAEDGTTEKNLTLAIARRIKELNTDPNIQIIMTREDDADTDLRARVAQARASGAGAFLSIHINRAPAAQSGIRLMMTKNDNDYAARSQVLGSLLAGELSKVYSIDGQLRKGADKGVWVLDAPEINYPSLLIEFGNLENKTDREFFKSVANQEKIATHLLNAVTQFANGSAKAIPSGIEFFVEEGTIDLGLNDGKVVKAHLSPLKKVSTRNIFPGEDYQANGKEKLVVDGIFLSSGSVQKTQQTISKGEKLVVISTQGREPLSTLLRW